MAKLGLDGRGFKAGLKEAEVQANKFGSGLKAQLAGAFSTAAMAGYVKSVAQTTGRIKDLSEQFRITTDEVQNTEYALQQSGLQFEQFGQALTKIGTARRDAVEGNEKLRDTFAKYGVTLTDLNNPQLRNLDLLQKLSGAMAGMTLTAREQTDITDLLGERSAKLLGVLQDLSQIKAPDLFTEEQIQRIDKAEKAWSRFFNFLKVKGAEQLEKISLTYGIGGPDIGELEELAKGAEMPITKATVIAANAAKRARLKAEAESATQGLFQVDGNKKETAATAGMSAREAAARAAFSIKAPSLPGLAQSGGFSGGIAAMDPRMFIEQNQLQKLTSIDAQLKQIQTIIGGKLGSMGGLLGAFSR